MIQKRLLLFGTISALACASALHSIALAQGTIAHFQPAQPISVVYSYFVFPPVYYDFDVDGDGSADYRFNLRDSFGVSVEPLGNNRQIGLPAIPPDLGSDLDPLPAGFQIGSSLPPTYYWVSHNSPRFEWRSLISACADFDGNYVCLGLFDGQDAYMGIEFQIEGQPHYGWVHINSHPGTPGGFILEWAYETRPNTPILAGAVPEPSQSTIAYFDGPAFQIPAPSGTRSLDLNRDGTPDFAFSSDSIICTADVPPSVCVWPFHVAAMGTNQLLASGAALTQPAGVIIANDPPSGATWVSAGATVSLTSYLSGHNRGVPYAVWTDSLGALNEGYLGVRFYAADGLHYGWIHVRLPNQEARTNGFPLELTPVVLDWAYETRPNTAIAAGAIVPPVQFTATFNGRNEGPANDSPHSGTGAFTLIGDTLIYQMQLGFGLRPTAAKLLGSARTTSNSRHLISDLGDYTILVLPPPGPVIFQELFPWPVLGVLVDISYTGQVTLTEKQIRQLCAGRLYVNFTSTNYPRGELRGAILPAAPISFTATLSGTNEVPRNASAHRGSVQFTLTGSHLAYTLAAVTNFTWSSVGIFGPAVAHANSGNLIAALDTSLGSQSGDQVFYSGALDLSDRDVVRLKRGTFFINIPTAQFPRGELRGQVIPQDGSTNGVPDFLDSYMKQVCPCNGAWKSHPQYIRAVRRAVLELAAARLVTGPQFRRIIRQAERSDCGNKH